MFSQYPLAGRVNLYLPDTFHACPFQAKIKPAHPSKQGHEP